MKGFVIQLGWELYRMFARRRTYIGFGVFVGLELLIVFLLSRPGPQRNIARYIEQVAGGAEQFFSALTLSFLVVLATVFLLAASFLALVSGDIVAKETEDGNLRLLLARPISRFRLLVIKYLSCQIYALTFFFFVGASVLAVGVFQRGWGGSFVAMPMPMNEEMGRVAIFGWWEGLGRYFLAMVFIAISFSPVTSLAFCLSCLKIKPAAATILTLAIFFADFILGTLRALPFLQDYQDWFVTPKMSRWVYAVNQEIPWFKVIENWSVLLGIGLTGFVLGWLAFERRDVKS